jgi:O-antigen/teichoic acid export membrane protein
MIVKRLFTNISFNFISVGLGFFNALIIAKYLNLQDYGSYTVLVTFASIASVFSDLGLSNTFVVYTNKFKDKTKAILQFYNFIWKFKNYIILVCAIISSFVVFYIGSTKILELSFIILFPFILVTNTILNYQNQVLNNWSRYGLINASMNFFRLVGLFLLLFLNVFNVDTLMIILLTSGFLQMFILLYLNKQYFKPHDIASTKSIVKLTKSFFILNCITIVASKSDIIIGEFLFNPKQLGLYSNAFVLASFFPVISSSLNQVLIRNSSIDILKKINKAINVKTVVFLFLMISLIWLFSDIVFRLFFNNKYDDSIILFKLLATIHSFGILFSPYESYFTNTNQNFLIKLKSIQTIILLITPFLFYNYLNWYSLIFGVLLSRLVGWTILSVKARKEL